MFRLGKGKALDTLAQLASQNFSEGERGVVDLYLIGLSDYNRNSHLYLQNVPNTVRIKQHIESKMDIRVATSLPDGVRPRRIPAVGIVASLRTEDKLPITANLLSFIWAAANNKVRFLRTTTYTPQPGDIFYLAYLDKTVTLESNVTDLACLVQEVNLRTVGSRRVYTRASSILYIFRDSLVRVTPEVGDYVRTWAELPHIMTDEVGVVIEKNDTDNTYTVEYSGGLRVILEGNTLVVVVAPEN